LSQALVWILGSHFLVEWVLNLVKLN
jgi:hypothetical protein